MSNDSARCEFMQYHIQHDYRTTRDEPRRCDGLYPPQERRRTLADVVTRLEGFGVDPDVIDHFRSLRDTQ